MNGKKVFLFTTSDAIISFANLLSLCNDNATCIWQKKISDGLTRCKADSIWFVSTNVKQLVTSLLLVVLRHAAWFGNHQHSTPLKYHPKYGDLSIRSRYLPPFPEQKEISCCRTPDFYHGFAREVVLKETNCTCGCRTEQWLQMNPDYKQCKLRRDGEPHERTWQCIVSKTGQNRFHKQIIQTEPAYFIWPAKIRHRCSFMPKKKADAKANYQLYWSKKDHHNYSSPSGSYRAIINGGSIYRTNGVQLHKKSISGSCL